MAAKYSVLIMGKTQAGKSTLVQHIKHYADPTYEIDASLLGNGNFSKTDITRPFLVRSNLPSYEAFIKETGEIIDLADIATKWENEEDYREVLFMREKKVGVRVAPQDPNAPSETVEFRFLDTPGLNDTNDRDSSHAANIISEVIQTRSFNLIVVIVSFKNPLTQEQQLALEYYADVFKGLHSRIMFLHTHVDYADIHHTNKPHQLNIKMKNKELSKIFRRQDSECTFDKDNVKDYPHFTIDLVSKKRPVINCLIRNTICTILKKATEPAVMLDTTGPNLDRINAIIHPSKYNDAEKKKVKQRFAEEASKLDRAPEDAPVEVGGKELTQINILLIGDVQSGKTSLVEMFRLYADPDYVANTQHISQGSSRFADEKVRVTPFLSNLHSIEIRKMRGETGEYDVIDLDAEAKKGSEEDFEDLLNLGQRAVTTTIVSPNSERYRFNIYEGPSLNESSENFEKHIFSVHKTVVESDQEFHQVLFTLPPGPITNAIRTTIRVCSDIFSDLAPLFSFVHTKTDYPKLHHTNKQFHDAMKERQEILQRFISSTANPYLIDCNLQSNWPVQRAKTYNIVHEILKTAVKQTPIKLKSPLMKKTPKMVGIDTNLKWQARDAFQDTQKEITKNNNDLLELRNKIRQFDIDYKEKDKVVNAAKNKEDASTRDDMEVVFHEKFSYEEEKHTEIYSRTMTFKKQARTIEKVLLLSSNMIIEQNLGGEGFNHWKIIYRRKDRKESWIEVKIYAKKQDGAGNPMSESPEMANIRRQKLELEKQLAVVEERIRSKWHAQKEYNLLRDWISRETLPKAVLEALNKAEVYEVNGTPFDKIREIYLNSGGVYDTDPCGPHDVESEMGADILREMQCAACKKHDCAGDCLADSDDEGEMERED
ncbi:hypothetical protein BG004_006772 [Podila humilis]|nr:hypothetical protein BG004_006772 [Podila humilis]